MLVFGLVNVCLVVLAIVMGAGTNTIVLLALAFVAHTVLVARS